MTRPIIQNEEERNVVVNPTMLLDGHTVLIGENLYNGLKSIRHLKSEICDSNLWLWVDALCINQSDVQEKGHQVRLMRQIYEAAEMVLVWLGTGDRHIRDAMKVLNLEAGEFEDHVFRGRLTEHEMMGISGISEMSYWQRVWILQEVVLATNYLVVCGNAYVTMENFERALSILCDPKWQIHDDRSEALLRRRVGLERSPAKKIITQRDVQGRTSPLYKWLLICTECFFGATDPRDFVYALLGISDNCEGKIEPDYSRSAREVYCSAIAVNKAERYNPYMWDKLAHMMGLDVVADQVWEEVCGREIEQRASWRKKEEASATSECDSLDSLDSEYS
ncbi:heterokaryon incompatibility protein-domain-containing protein [Copromyces sp. CBS 386.78]|nr:heterokaryon incompatibility protein-domain-containing protein [Copromyces sp. CBS 386.78]